MKTFTTRGVAMKTRLTCAGCVFRQKKYRLQMQFSRSSPIYPLSERLNSNTRNAGELQKAKFSRLDLHIPFCHKNFEFQFHSIPGVFCDSNHLESKFF